MSCTRCPLHKGALTVEMTGRGRESGGILIVASAPSSQDDCEGTLLSGPQGHLLTEMLRDAGYAPDDYRLTSAVRCTVGVAKTENIDACRPHLIGEVHRARPEVIIAMGEAALRSLCKRSGFAGVRGQALPLHPDFEYEAEVYAIYAPGYVLRVPQTRSTVVADLRRVRDLRLPEEPIAWRRGEAPDFLAHGPVALDIETSFFEDGKNTITQIAYAVPDRPPRMPYPVVVSKRVPMVVTGNPIIGHNILNFDARHLQEQGAALIGPIDDTMALAYLDDETQPRSLEALAVKYLGVRGWKDGLHAPPGSDEFAAYNARDARYTLRLHEVLCAKLGERKRVYDGVMRPAHAAFSACEKRGIFINQEAAARWDTYYTLQAEALLKIIQASSSIANPRSPQQVADYFFGDKKHCADKAQLLALPSPIAKAILDYRHAHKMLSTYVHPYAEAGRIHLPSNILGTDTGRVTARYHNMPRELKDMFGAPEGKVLVSFDYAAIEFRFAMWHAGVENVLALFRSNPDFDPHRWFAGIFYDRDVVLVSNLQRQVAKSGNFGLLYKSSPPGLAEYAYKTSGNKMPLKTAYAVRAAWLQALPQIPTWWERVERDVKLRGYVESVFGRRRHFGDPKLLPKGGSWNDIVRAAINHEVQSACTDIAQTGLILCHRAGFPINGFQHDSIMFEFDSMQEAQIAEPVIIDLMTTKTVERLEAIFGVRIDVPLVVEPTYTYTQSKEEHHATSGSR